MQMEGHAWGKPLAWSGILRPSGRPAPFRLQLRMNFPLNNNRSNRRRGRGSNRSPGGGQLNRIDSRARGNAPQLLEKYKKLAHDASLNGDRVQTEYYLQFADHYFRVIADTKARQDEHRSRRDEPREQSTDSEDEDDEFAIRQPERSRSRRPERSERDDAKRDEAESESGKEAANEYEPSENPFTRGNRERTSPRRPRKPRAEAAEAGDKDNAGDDAAGKAGGKGEPGFDSSILPPSIGAASDEAEEAPAPRRRRTTRTKAAAKDASSQDASSQDGGSNDGDETLQQVG